MRTSLEWDHNPTEDEVDAASEALHLASEQVRKCDYGEAGEIQARAKAAFVENNPAKWWLTWGLGIAFVVVLLLPTVGLFAGRATTP